MRPDRRRSIGQARALLDDSPFVFDTETTGLGSDDEIVEIAIISVDGTVLLDSLVKPRFPVPPEATRIHGIGNADLAQAPTILELLPQLQQLFADRLVTSYNLDYDIRMVRQSLAAVGGCRPQGWPTSNPSHCIMELYARFWGAWNDYHGSYTLQSLGNALSQCSLTTEDTPHRALGDAKGALKVLQYMALTSFGTAQPL